MLALQQAIDLATKAHKGQWRKPTIAKPHYILKSGDEIYKQDGIVFIRQQYIKHPLAVMNMMTTEEERIVAVLHDVIEDTEWQLSEIISDEGNFYSILYQPATDNGVFEQECYGISKDVYKALDVLTKLPNQSYADYLERITSSKLATKVKLADMFHNISDNPSEHAKQKYLKAIPILLQNL